MDKEKKEEEDFLSYLEFFKALAKKYGIVGNPFLEEEDLLQEVFLISLQIERDYGGEIRDRERIIKRAAKLHVITLIRDLHYTPKKLAEKHPFISRFSEKKKQRKGYPFYLPEFEIESFGYSLKGRLSPEASRVFSEFENPSDKTLRLAEEARLRRIHLKAQGKNVYSVLTVKITQEIIRQSLNLSRTRLYKCIQEIKRKARELKKEIEL